MMQCVKWHHSDCFRRCEICVFVITYMYAVVSNFYYGQEDGTKIKIKVWVKLGKSATEPFKYASGSWHQWGNALYAMFQVTQWHDRVTSQAKAYTLIFFNIHGIVYCEFVPQEHVVNKVFYSNISKHLREDIWWKQKDLWSAKSWIHYHNNAPGHNDPLTCEFSPKTYSIHQI